MNVGDLVKAMDEIAPRRLAPSWDNVGLLVGDPAMPLTRVLLAIDCTRGVLNEASHGGFEALVAYHPVIFTPTKRFSSDSMAYLAARMALSVYCPHTSLDIAPGGTNDVLADVLGVQGRRPLSRGSSLSGEPAPSLGFGRVGEIDSVPLREVVARLKRAVDASHVLVAGSLDRAIRRVAVLAGSGGDFIEDALASGADLLVTGELRHHETLRAQAAGLAVVCTRHSVSERIALAPLAKRLEQSLAGLFVACSSSDRDPFEIC